MPWCLQGCWTSPWKGNSRGESEASAGSRAGNGPGRGSSRWALLLAALGARREMSVLGLPGVCGTTPALPCAPSAAELPPLRAAQPRHSCPGKAEALPLWRRLKPPWALPCHLRQVSPPCQGWDWGAPSNPNHPVTMLSPSNASTGGRRADLSKNQQKRRFHSIPVPLNKR